MLPHCHAPHGHHTVQNVTWPRSQGLFVSPGAPSTVFHAHVPSSPDVVVDGGCVHAADCADCSVRAAKLRHACGKGHVLGGCSCQRHFPGSICKDCRVELRGYPSVDGRHDV